MVPIPLDSECCVKDKSVDSYMGDILDVGKDSEEEINEKEELEEGEWEL